MVPREDGKGGKQGRKVDEPIRGVLPGEILNSQAKGFEPPAAICFQLWAFSGFSNLKCGPDNESLGAQ